MDDVERVTRAIFQKRNEGFGVSTEELQAIVDHGWRHAADDATAAIAAVEPKWIKPTDCLPEKPGKSDYEYVDCLIVHKGNVKMRPWNCEHKCFDDEEYDDYFCDAQEVELWMAVPALPAPPAAEAGVDGGGV